jgi:hypothetical protein
MTTQIFFRNNTPSEFELYDSDGTHYSTIRGGYSYSLSLPFSESFEKIYNLILQTNNAIIITFSININGFIGYLNSNSPTFVVFKTFEDYSGGVYGDNKIVIDTGGLTFPPQPFPIVGPGVLYYNDY